ncbi:protein of unknown function [Streptomyces sp. KY75]|nr:protein of unknown function [Streptomyces sp. KY75]
MLPMAPSRTLPEPSRKGGTHTVGTLSICPKMIDRQMISAYRRSGC